MYDLLKKKKNVDILDSVSFYKCRLEMGKIRELAEVGDICIGMWSCFLYVVRKETK